MDSTDKPRRARDHPGRNTEDIVRATSPDGPIALDQIDRRTHQSGPVAAAAVAQSGAPPSGRLAHVPAKVWVVGGVVALLLFFVLARSLLHDPTTSARHESPASKRASDSSASTSTTTSPVPRTDSSRNVTPTHPSTNLPGQKPTVAIVIPRSGPPSEQASDPPPQTEVSPPPVAAPEAVAPQRLDLGQVEDAKRVQQRLADLGFLFGTADGAWGPRSRRALQDFRVAHGLGDNDTWDEATQELLLGALDANAASTSDISFIGGWGVDGAQCREEPLTITERRAEVSGASCEFRSTQRESLNVWRLRAQCAKDGERWNANIRFTLSGNKLIWSSERGTTTYMRCPS
jgi:hypothetical protein